MPKALMIIRRFSDLLRVYPDLGPGDVFIGQVPGSHLKSAMLVDLTARGVRLLPSATAQMISGSKTAQAFLLRPWMPPHTRVIARRRDLLDAVGEYHRLGIHRAVTKQEQLHCGQGVRQWNDLEMLYSCLSLDDRHFPFVLQPFRTVAADVRVVVVGEYWEAYARINPNGFRMNLSAGGRSSPHALGDAERALCRTLMARAQMPYAHIDLMKTAEGETYLSEISLTGGVHGAAVSQADVQAMKQGHLEALAQGGASSSAGRS